MGTSQGNEISSANNDILKGDSLCEEHDDGGVVTHYGYGYFYANSNNLTTSLSAAYFNEDFMIVAKNTEAGEALGKQMPGYTFVAYETGEDKMYLIGNNANGTWWLDYGSGTDATVYAYTVNPFFANSMSLDNSKVQSKTTKTGDVIPGANGNAYEIRSVSQLQFINWNSGKCNTNTSIVSQNKGDWYTFKDKYTYQVYGDTRTVSGSGKELYWNQTHDLNASLEYRTLGKANNFTPIGSMYDNAGDTATADPTMSYFASHYDGQAYTIKNVEIHSNAECVGIFGITVGATVKNVVVYSDEGNVIEATKEGESWYCVGGLVGFAAGRDNPASVFTNCTVSGYTIQDNHANTPGWGGGSVGGLVGMTNMDITNCSAVTDIIINIGYNGHYQNLRVGGIAGVSRGAVRYCYAGGSMRSTAKFWYSNYTQGANIWMGGLVGGIVMRNSGGLATLVGDVSRVLKVENCYSYVEMPKRGKANEQNIIKSTQAIASNGEMQENFANVKNDYIEIHNCYALESAVLNTDDYREYGGKTPSSWSNLNLNMTHQGLRGREIKLFNDSTPYVSYAEMQSSDFLTKLNKNYQSGSSYKSFSTVTITEQGQNIDGKYSFPGNDTALQGLNYPFPTVLTQTDIFGSTVNLHYGRWPRIGLLWEENSQKLDLLADIKTKAEDSTLNDDENGKALLQTHLLIASSDVDTSAVPEIKLYDEDRNELTNDKAAATVSRIAYNGENNCYDVTFIGQNVGTVIAEAKLGNYIARLTIEVTASLKLEASSTNISVYSGDTDTITLTVKDANDKQLLAETEKTLRWEIAVDNNGVQQDVIECSKDDIKLNADGTFSLPLTGFAAGEATVSITCTYPYGAATAAEPAKEVTATLYISATTKPSDVLGLTNGSVYNQISLPHTPKKSTTSYTGTTVEYPENRPAMQGSALFLYATDEYTDLKNGFTVDQIEITAGETTYTVGEDGITTDENHTYTDENHTYKVTVSDQWTTKTNDTKFRYRAVKVESAAAGEITLKIVLKNGDVTYNLTTPYTIASNTYTVKFLDTKGNILLTKTVDYGEKPTLTEEEKNGLATAILGYTFDFDNLPEIFADTEIKAVPNTYTIQFNANGGSGMMPDESYAYDKIQTTDSLPPNTFTGTSAFKGWAFDASSTTADYTDASLIENIIGSMAKGNKTELTLYAVWEDTAAGGETVEP